MSSISSISGGDSGLYQLFQRLRSGTTTEESGSSQSTQSGDGTSSTDNSTTNPFTTALKAQGLSDSQISSLQAKIQTAVQSAVQNSGTSSDPISDVQSAVDQTLKDNGVDVSKFQASLQSSLGSLETGGQPPVGNSSGFDSSQFQTKLDSLLQQHGIDPKEFRKELFSSSQTSGDGTSQATSNDSLSNLFSSLGTGSTVDVAA